MDFHDPVRRDLRGSFLIVSGCPVGVDSVLEDGHIPVSDEVQVKGKVARIPIRQRPDVPDVSAAAGHGDIFTDLSANRNCLIPDGRDSAS